MNLHTLPTHERQIVYFINDSEADNLHHYDEGKKLLLSKEIQIVPLSNSEEFLNHYAIIDGRHPTHQMMLIISPTDPRKYAEVEESTAHFALNKLTAIIRLCQLLGAKQLFIEDIYTEKEESTTKTDTTVAYTVTTSELSTERQKENELKKFIGYRANFTGGEANYLLAKAYLKKHYLNGDDFLSNLAEMFDPEFPSNPLTVITRKVKLSSISSNAFKLLANLKIPVGGGQFEINTKNISRKDYTLKINIEF